MGLLSIAEQNRSLALYYGANKGSIASPSHQVALYAGDPENGGVELDSFGGYVRPVATNNGTTWATPAGGSVTSAVLSLAVSTDEWTVAGAPAVADYFLLFATDTGDAGDSGQLADPISVGGAGETPRIQLTVFYDNTGA